MVEVLELCFAKIACRTCQNLGVVNLTEFLVDQPRPLLRLRGQRLYELIRDKPEVKDHIVANQRLFRVRNQLYNLAEANLAFQQSLSLDFLLISQVLKGVLYEPQRRLPFAQWGRLLDLFFYLRLELLDWGNSMGQLRGLVRAKTQICDLCLRIVRLCETSQEVGLFE